MSKKIFEATLIEKSRVNIAICGLFQIGKSTTINVMLGAREICAISAVAGIRTSACNIFISGSDQESCRLELLTDDEICDKLARTLDVKLDRNDLWRHERRENLWRVLIELWRDDPDDLERSRLEEASLLLSGIGFLPSIRRIVQNASSGESSRLGMAPADERLRWHRFRHKMFRAESNEFRHLLREEFPIQEVIYPFVKKIFVQLNTPWLIDNNFCIIDTPGLNANARDTSIALQAIGDADSVMYIFSSENELKEMERQFLYDLRGVLGERKIMFVVNSRRQLNPKVLSAIQSVLYECGYNSRLITYNALLALRAEQGRRLLLPRAPRNLIKNMIAQAREKGHAVYSAAEAWSALTVKELLPIETDVANFIEQRGLCLESVEMLSRKSDWQKILCALKYF